MLDPIKGIACPAFDHVIHCLAFMRTSKRCCSSDSALARLSAEDSQTIQRKPCFAGGKIVINYLLTSSDIKTETGALPNRIFPTVEGDNNVNFKTDAGGEIAFNDVAFSIVQLQQWV